MVTQLGASALAVPDSLVRMFLGELQLVFAHLPLLPRPPIQGSRLRERISAIPGAGETIRLALASAYTHGSSPCTTPCSARTDLSFAWPRCPSRSSRSAAAKRSRPRPSTANTRESTVVAAGMTRSKGAPPAGERQPAQVLPRSARGRRTRRSGGFPGGRGARGSPAPSGPPHEEGSSGVPG
jgi:hypothetical protein